MSEWLSIIELKHQSGFAESLRVERIRISTKNYKDSFARHIFLRQNRDVEEKFLEHALHVIKPILFDSVHHFFSFRCPRNSRVNHPNSRPGPFSYFCDMFVLAVIREKCAGKVQA